MILENDIPVCCASPGVPDQPSMCGRKNLPKQCFGSLRDRFLPCWLGRGLERAGARRVDGDIDAPGSGARAQSRVNFDFPAWH